MRIRPLNSKHRARGAPDAILLLIIFCLIVFGIVALSSASSHLAQKQFDDSAYYVKHQLAGLGLGIIGFLVALFFPYHRYERASLVLLLMTIGLLVLVLTLGISFGGAVRWLNVGIVTIQPAEILKATFIIYLAAWLAKTRDRRHDVRRGLIPFLMMMSVIAFLLLKQPATSTFVILGGVAAIMYFMSGAPLRHLGILALLGGIGIASIVAFSPYRIERVMTFLNPETNVLSSGYQLYQARLSIGSGGLWGVGYGKSIAKIRYLPEPIGDSIFAVIAEEFGFIGALLLISAFCTLVVRTLFIARRIDDQFGKLLLVGFGTLIGLQAFINMAAISGLLPLTGMPLPFISYGGTALFVFMTIAGIVLHVSRYAKR